MHFHHCDIPCHLAPFVKLYRDTFSLCGLVRSFIVYGTSIVDRHRTCFLVCVCACRSKRTLIATLFEAQPILLLSLSAASWEQTFCIVRAKQTMFTDTNDLWCTCTCCNGFSAPVLLFSLFFFSSLLLLASITRWLFSFWLGAYIGFVTHTYKLQQVCVSRAQMLCMFACEVTLYTDG